MKEQPQMLLVLQKEFRRRGLVLDRTRLGEGCAPWRILDKSTGHFKREQARQKLPTISKETL